MLTTERAHDLGYAVGVWAAVASLRGTHHNPAWTEGLVEVTPDAVAERVQGWIRSYTPIPDGCAARTAHVFHVEHRKLKPGSCLADETEQAFYAAIPAGVALAFDIHHTPAKRAA